MTLASMLSCRSAAVRCAWCVMALLGGVAGVARADAPSAASLFDDGVHKFERAEYEAAAAAFLAADEAAPNAQALLNAIAAGRRGHAHLLVARAAERALARPGTGADLAHLAREALTEASAHLARVELSCVTSPPDGGACALAIDGAAALPGARYMLPGTHRFTGEDKGDATAAARPPARDEKALTCEAGATYVVALHPEAAPAAASAPASPSSAPSSAPRGSPAGDGWPPAVVYAGAGVTAVLVGVTVWSGVDAIDAKKALPPVPLRAQNEDVLSRAHRTDALLAGAAIAAAATVVAGVWLVGWGGGSRPSAAVAVAASPAGASAIVRGRF